MQVYTIGDRVKVKLLNKPATVTDALYSDSKDKYMYLVRMDDSSHDYVRAMSEEDLEPLTSEKDYRWEVFRDGNVITAVMYEVYGDQEREIDRKHGKINYDGEIGVAQAASYAMKRIYIDMNGGQYIQSEGNSI